METLQYSEQDLSIDHMEKTRLECMIDSEWNKAMAAGFFKYTLNDLESKILPGERSFIVQLNKLRFQERRKPQPIQRINEPFDPSKFNFTKIKDGEIMFRVTDGRLESHFLVNVSPIEFGHSLLVPNLSALRNQVLDSDALRLGLHALLLCSNPSIRVAFNSLCAHASVNHLHLHIWYLNHTLFVQTMTADYLSGICYEMSDHEVGGFAWELKGVQHVSIIVDQLSKVISCFVEKGIAHNLFITKASGFLTEDDVIRVLLWPRKSVIELKTENNYNIAVAELAGHIPVKNPETFDTVDEEEIIQAYRDIRLDENVYSSLKSEVIHIIKAV